MSNNLTGDYEAVLQLATRQINGLLGTLHQNAEPPQSQTLPVALYVFRPPFPYPSPFPNPTPAVQTPHSITARISERGILPTGGGVFEDWVLDFQRAGPGQGLRDIQTQLTATAPPGAARMLADAFASLRAGWVIVPPGPGQLQGTAKIQASSVTITVTEGSSTEIIVNANIRAAYYPDPGTTDLPAPIHGDVQAAFEVRTTPSSAGTRLVISPTTQDAGIQFHAAPGSGLSAGDESTIAFHVRNFLRDELTLVPVDLPANFAFTAFKGLGSGPSAVVALPFQLSGAAAPTSGVQPLTQSFIGSSGFAVAVSKEYVAGLIDIDAIRRALDGYTITLTLSGPFGISASVTYTLSFTSGPTLTFQSGGIAISGKVAASGNKWWSPNGWVSFTQVITLALDPSTQTVTPVRAGDPSVDQSWFIPHDIVVNIVRSQVDSALTNNTPAIRKVFADARNNLLNGLKTFDAFPSVTYSGVEITPDGVIVRGEIGSGTRQPPVIDIAETDNATAFTAFESWIPAGRIDRFIWSWVEHPHNTVIGGIQETVTDEHRFIFPKQVDATQLGQICLRIEGTQILPGGQEISVAGGTTCSPAQPVLEMDFPAWFGPVTLPIWRPGTADSSVLKDAIAAHVSIQASVPAKEPLSRNMLVYFTQGWPDKPLDSLNAALTRAKNSSTMMVVIVLPAGAFDRTRREIESRLPASGERRVLVHFTEDNEGGWTSMFAVGKRPSVYLVNARREFVWKHEGEPDPAELAAAIDRFQVPTSAPRFRRLRLKVSQGDVAPDASFETDAGDQFVLHRLRGREVLLNFWQSWSAPCLTELARLQRLHESSGRGKASQDSSKGSPFIVGFHGGNNRDAMEQVRRRLGLSFPLVQDSQQRIAQQFGVRCWPTTVLVGTDGRTQHVQLGVAHEPAASLG
jgi:peroxiredoxin